MKRVLLCLTLLVSLWPAHAQENAVRVPYSRKVPSILLRRIPRGGATIYYGACRLRSNEPEVLFHVYTAPKRASRRKTEPSDQPQLLDVYERKFLSKYGKPVLINSIPFGVGQNEEGYRTSAQVIWAHPKRRYIPILLMETRLIDMSFGSGNSMTLVIFSRGLKQKPTLASYSDRVDNSGGNNVSFDKTDERGFTMVTDRHMSAAADSDPSNATYYSRWNGNGFSPVKNPHSPQKAPAEPE